jgi:hypothetical protein
MTRRTGPAEFDAEGHSTPRALEGNRLVICCLLGSQLARRLRYGYPRRPKLGTLRLLYWIENGFLLRICQHYTPTSSVFHILYWHILRSSHCHAVYFLCGTYILCTTLPRLRSIPLVTRQRANYHRDNIGLLAKPWLPTTKPRRRQVEQLLHQCCAGRRG